MSASITERILAAAYTALYNNLTGVGTRVYRTRDEAFAKNETPAISIEPDAEDTAVFGTDIDRNELTIRIDIIIRDDSAPAEQIADPIRVQVHSLLMASTAIGALVARIRRSSTRWDSDEADRELMVVSQTYRLVYLARANDISKQP